MNTIYSESFVITERVCFLCYYFTPIRPHVVVSKEATRHYGMSNTMSEQGIEVDVAGSVVYVTLTI